jgi:DNA helicase-2/ATP-dependent DNA helicase PcrA
MTALRKEDAEWPAQLDLVRQWYQPHLERKHADAIVRAGDLDQLQRIAAAALSRTQFLTDLTLDPPSATSDESGTPLLDEDYLILSTIHSAKGQKWKSVFVLNVVDGSIPSDMATGNVDEIEEERRLLYVAMTRAKAQLALIVPHRFYVHGQARGGDKHLYASRSHFIPSAIVNNFDVYTWPLPARRASGARPGAGITIDLAACMRGMWPTPAPSWDDDRIRSRLTGPQAKVGCPSLPSPSDKLGVTHNGRSVTIHTRGRSRARRSSARSSGALPSRRSSVESPCQNAWSLR